MIRRLFSVIGLLTLATLPALSWANSTAAAQQNGLQHDVEHEQQLARVIELSGLTGLSLQARHLAQRELNKQQAALGFQYQVAGRVTQLWSPVQLTERLKQPLQSLTQQQLQQLIKTLNSQVMRQARSKENAAVAGQDSAEFLAYVEKLRAQPPSVGRLKTISDLDQAMHFSDLILQTRASVYAQLQAVLKNWQPPANWQTQLQAEAQEFLLYTYRRTPNDGIAALTRAYQQPALKAWLQASSTLLKDPS
ncbi:hypothetical protein [Bacterioplanoides sp.]|uniref:hypothetical protein n=1 Tax=Bacterioplanoides sp. TaxID=2066072 RepID=UPI003B00D090